MEKGNPHAMSAGASLSIGPDANTPITALPLNSIAFGIPPAHLLRALAENSREHLEWFIQTAIDVLDDLDGDPDEENANDLEDDFALTPFALHNAGLAPGCPVSDPDQAVDDEPCDEPFQDLELECGPTMAGGGSGFI